MYWQAISESSVKSYNKFCKEYPELAKRVEFEDRTSKTLLNDFNNSFVKSEEEKQAILDEVFNDSYNSEKGVITDESKIYNNGEQQGSKRAVQSDDIQASNTNNRQYTIEDNERGSVSSSNNRERSNSSTGIDNMDSNNTRVSNDTDKARQENIQSGTGRAAEQSPTDRLVNSNGNIEEIAKALDDTILNLDPQTFENLADNADAYYNKLAEAGVTDVTGLKEAFAQGDINYVRFVVSKQLAAERLISDLMEEVKQGADDIRVNDIFESINYLHSYIV